MVYLTMTIDLKSLLGDIVDADQQVCLTLDSMVVVGTADDLMAMLNDECLNSRVQCCSAADGCVLKLWATLVEEEAKHEES